jgi:hypothetical protein
MPVESNIDVSSSSKIMNSEEVDSRWVEACFKTLVGSTKKESQNIFTGAGANKCVL